MKNVHMLPDQRIPKAMGDILDILLGIEPPIHVATAIGILDMCKLAVLEELEEVEE